MMITQKFVDKINYHKNIDKIGYLFFCHFLYNFQINVHLQFIMNVQGYPYGFWHGGTCPPPWGGDRGPMGGGDWRVIRK